MSCFLPVSGGRFAGFRGGGGGGGGGAICEGYDVKTSRSTCPSTQVLSERAHLQLLRAPNYIPL